MSDRPTNRALTGDGAVRILIDRIGELEEVISTLPTRGELDRLADRLATLEAASRLRGTGRQGFDDASIAAVRFMEKHWPMRFTALTLEENLQAEGLTNERLGSRLRRLKDRGLVKAHERDGRTAMWSALPPQERQQGAESDGE